MISSVAQYIVSAENISVMSRSLQNCKCYRNERGEIDIRVGNSSVVVRIDLNGEMYGMKVYCKSMNNLHGIYKEMYLPKELMILCGNGRYEWSDVVLTRWIEGETLQQYIERECGNSKKMLELADAFEKFASDLLDTEWAHGDIKPENIILNKEGLHLIDFDAMFHPDFSVEDINEVGTRTYQHPLRHTLFNKDIDDYPITLIAVALRAIAFEPALGEHLQQSDYLLINPAEATNEKSVILDHIEELFARQGDARHYHLARLLRCKTPSLPPLRELLCSHHNNNKGITPELAEEKGLWGYRVEEQFVIPPIYDIGFEFSEGAAAVKVGEEWHFIDEQGEVIIHCGRGHKLKPLHCGLTHITREDGSIATIYRDGRIVEASNG